MPKRAPTPPPDKESEPKYLTITFPYPLFANLEDKRDLMDMAHWLGCIVEPKYLCALYWKPSGHNHVILEVTRTMPAFERLLGEHRWSQFLTSPTDEERDKVTRIYWSTYSTRRQIDKEGWKCREFQDAWFAKWNKSLFRAPYPASHWCDLASEDPTNKNFCRHIPKSLFGGIDATPPEIVPVKPAKSTLAPTPAPGTAEWIAMKNGTGPARIARNTAQAPAGTKAWNRPIVVNPSKRPAAAAAGVWGVTAEDADAGALAAAASGRANTVPVDTQEDEYESDTELGGPNGKSWADEVTDAERRKEEKPLSAGPGACAWPPPGPVDDEIDQSAEDLERNFSVQSALYNIPILTPQDEILALATQRNASGSYNGGLGRDGLAGWTCPTHGDIKLCSRGVCNEASAELSRRRRARDLHARRLEQISPFIRNEQRGAGGSIRRVERGGHRGGSSSGTRTATASPAPSSRAPPQRHAQSVPPGATNGMPIVNRWASGASAAVLNKA